MRSIISRSLVGLLTLCVGIAAVSFWLGIHRPKGTAHPVRVHEPSTAPSPEAFTPLPKGGDWYTSAGCIHDEFYRAWDGSEIIFSHLFANTPAQAARQMKRHIEVIYTEQAAVRSAVLNESGKKVGERVTGLRRIDTEGRERVAIMWVEGSDFFTIEGWSMERVLEFERQKIKQ